MKQTAQQIATQRQAALRALQAWAIGLCVAGASLMPIQHAYDFTSPSELPAMFLSSIVMLPIGVALAVLVGGIVTLPLFVLALPVAVFGHGVVRRNPIAWSMLASAIAALIHTLVIALIRDNPWALATPWSERVWVIARGEETSTVAFAVFCASVYFACGNGPAKAG